MTLLHYIMLFVMLAWVAEAVLCAMQVRRFNRELTRPRRKEYEAYTPFAAIIVPFKGIDEDMPQAIASLCEQDYPDYRLIFVVDDEKDPAYAVLKAQADRYPDRRIDIVISGQAPATIGQKVHNQLFAIGTLTDRDAVWVFADSDAVPDANWLARMVNPLMNRSNGMTTGYRWLVPAAGCHTLAAKLASVINSSVACGYRSKGISQAWGGAMALRRETARDGRLTDYLRGALTDDYQFTRMCRDMGLRVYFVPRVLVATPVDFNWSSFLNFAHRQYLITRIYAPRLFYAGLAITGLYVLGLIVTLIALAEGLFVRSFTEYFWVVPALVLFIIAVANRVRAAYRGRVIRNAFGEATLQTLRPTHMLDREATTAWMTLHFLLIGRACVGNIMRWRGIRYQLKARQNIRKLDD